MQEVKIPAKSKRQQRFMGAELTRRRAGRKTVTGMSEAQLREFAGTRRKGLPALARRARMRRRKRRRAA